MRGLKSLSDVARMDERVEAYHAGFLLGPRVNAGGRVGKSDLGARLLSTDDPILANELARQLDVYNQERRAIEDEVLADAMRQAEAQAGDNPHLMFVAGHGWHAGRDRHRRRPPERTLSTPGLRDRARERGLGKASGRSVSGSASRVRR